MLVILTTFVSQSLQFKKNTKLTVVYIKFYHIHLSIENGNFLNNVEIEKIRNVGMLFFSLIKIK